MSRIGVTAKDVIRAAENLVLQGTLPTAMQIRKYLGHGSSTTVQKYFRAWQYDRYRDNIATTKAAGKIEQVGILELEDRFSKLQEHNEHLSQELITAEQELMRLRGLEQNLDNINKDWHTKITMLQETLTKQEELINKLTQSNAEAIQIIIADKNQLIAALRLELKVVNQQGLEQVRLISYREQELLMEAKAKNITLQAQVTEQQKQLKTNVLALEKSQKDNATLRVLVNQNSLNPRVNGEA